MNLRVPLFDPDLGQAELDAVERVVRSKWLTMGEVTAEFEARFARLLGCRHAIALNSGTAALHLAMVDAGVGPGDEVVCPSLTFVATANAIRFCGARPVFADVASLDEWNVSRASLEAACTPRTRAVIVVHYAGFPCAMDEIVPFARSRGLRVVEDVAHAPGGRFRDKALGTWGDAGCFSFFSNKNMTTGEGGMLTTDDDGIAERARLGRAHGMTTVTLDRHRGHAHAYDVVGLGYNYRMGELNAALGLAQLDRLERSTERRAALVARYRERLAAVPGLHVPFPTSRGEPAWHIFPVLLPEGLDRDAVMDEMRAAGVQTSIHYRPIDTFTAYVEAGLGPSDRLPLTHAIGRRVLTLPLYPSMSGEQLELVCDSLAGALSRGARAGSGSAPRAATPAPRR